MRREERGEKKLFPKLESGYFDWDKKKVVILNEMEGVFFRYGRNTIFVHHIKIQCDSLGVLRIFLTL